jgi:hypothetical protein
MKLDISPSTEWQEQVGADEAERFAGYGRKFAQLQARKAKHFGPGRALHRKQLSAAHGELQVLADIPAFAQYGLFAEPASLEVRVRLSNGGMDRAPDRTPDVRGFAFSVAGVQGESALGNGPATRQDFTLINQPAFAFAKSEEFVAFVLAAANGKVGLLKYLVARYGLVAGTRRLLKLMQNLGRPFGGFATETLFSAVPMACGPYAVRVRLVPAPGNGEATRGAEADWGADFAARLARQSLKWELQLQPFVSEALTPIEDASVDWPSPYVTVARLSLPRQDAASATGQDLLRQVEAAVFDPWQALAAHRPLGDVQRARKVVYFESQKGRGAQ